MCFKCGDFEIMDRSIKKASSYKCCVPNCDDKYSPRFKFPIPKDQYNMNLFKIWLKNINNPMLSNRSYDEIHKIFRVCARHFPQDKLLHGSRRGISENAVPVLFLNSKLLII